MRTFAWQGTQPVFSRKEITSRSLFILQTEDEAFISFSRDMNDHSPYKLVMDAEDAHRFATFDRAFAVHLQLQKDHGESTSILSL